MYIYIVSQERNILKHESTFSFLEPLVLVDLITTLMVLLDGIMVVIRLSKVTLVIYLGEFSFIVDDGSTAHAWALSHETIISYGSY